MIFKKINFKLIYIILLFFCTQHIKCKHVAKRSIMQDLMSNFMQILDPKSNQKHMPYKIIKSETIDGKVQKYTVPNVDNDKLKDLNNAIKLLSIQSMLNRHYKNQYRKHKMMKEVEQLNQGIENNEQLKKLNEHTLKKYKYIDTYNNHRFNKEMLKLQKQAQKLIENSPELFKNVQEPQYFSQNPQEQRLPDFYTNSHGPDQNLRSKHKNEQSTKLQKTPQVFLLSPNEISTQKYTHDSSAQSFSPNHVKYTTGKVNDMPEHLAYYSLPITKESFGRVPMPHPASSHLQRYNTKQLSYSRPFRGPKDIPWSMKHKSPEVFLSYQQDIPWSVVPLPPPLPTLNMIASNNDYRWAVGGSSQTLQDNTATPSNRNSYWALKPLPPPMQSQFGLRDMTAAESHVSKDCHNNEDITIESTSDPYVLNTYSKNSRLKTDISSENYDDLHITQESTKQYTIDTRNNDSKRKDKEDNQQKESTVQQYSINPILAQQYQRYSNQQKNIVKNNNNTQSENSKHKENSSSKHNKKQEQVQSATNQRENNTTNPTTYTRKYTPKNQKQLINPEQTQNFNVNQEKILQQRQQQLKLFYEKQKQQRQQIRNNNKNLIADTKNVQDNGSRSYMFNSKLNTQQVATIPIDIAIPIEESDWIPIQPKYKVSNMNSIAEHEYVPLISENNDVKNISKNPVSNVDVMMVFSNETKVKDSKESPKLDSNEEFKNASANQTLHLETRREITNSVIEDVDESIRKMTFNKPIYDVPLINDKNSIASEKTVFIEIVNSDPVKSRKKTNSMEDIEVSESNNIAVKVKFDDRKRSLSNNSTNSEKVVSPVRHYERIKIKSKHKKYTDDEILNLNQTSSLDNTKPKVSIPSDVKVSGIFSLQDQMNDTQSSNQSLVKDTYFPVSTEKTLVVKNEKEGISIKNSEANKLNRTETIPLHYKKGKMVKDLSSHQDKSKESLSLVVENENDTVSLRKTPQVHGKNNDFNMFLQNDTKNAQNYDRFDISEEYEPSSTNIKELIANRSKIIRPFFRKKQELNLSITTTSTTTSTTTMKPIVVQHVERHPKETIRDQKFEESKTQNNYDEYDDQLSFENIRAAQAFNFPKTDISYNVDLPKSSQSVFKSISNERVVNPNRKQSRNRYRDEKRNPQKQKDQHDYENREVQTYVNPSYDGNAGQYSVYESTNPYEGGGQTFYSDDESPSNDGVDLHNIKIPSPEDIDLDSIDIPNPETIGVKGVGSGLDDDSDRDKEETGDDDDTDSEKDNDNEGDIDEENGDDAENEESKTRKQIDTSLRQQKSQQITQQNNPEQNNMDSEKSHTEKHFDLSSIPIPEFDEEKMNKIKEKYNIPSANLELLETQEGNHNDDNPALVIPKDHLVKNEYNDEIPNYNVPLEFSQEQNNHGEENNFEEIQSHQNNFDDGISSPYNTESNNYMHHNEKNNFPYISDEEKFRMRNMLKNPLPDQFDQDEEFGYAKFSDEDQRSPDFDEFTDGPNEKRDPIIQRYNQLDTFNTATQDPSYFRNVQSNEHGKIIESHIVKPIPIAFKTVIKPVSHSSVPFSPLAHKFQKPKNDIQQPFRPSVQLQEQARVAGHQKSQDNRQSQQYFGHSKAHVKPSDQYGRNLQPEIVPALEYDLSQFGGIFQETPQTHNQQQQSHNHAPQYSQTRFNVPQRNGQTKFSNSFVPTTKIRSQLDPSFSQVENSNSPLSENTLSNSEKIKSISNVNIHRHTSHNPAGSNNDQSNSKRNQPIIGNTENTGTYNSDYFNTKNLNVFHNQLENPVHFGSHQSTNSNLKQGLVVYHPTKTQGKSISHVLITPPTVERQVNYNLQPQIQEKNFQHTTTGPPNSQQKRVKAQHTRINNQPSRPTGLTLQSDVGRFRYIKDYNNNNQNTNTLQQINKNNRVPQQYNHLRKPTAPPRTSSFRNIPVGDHGKNNFRPQLPPPRPTYTLQQIQNIKNSNLPPHIKEYSEFKRPQYDFSSNKNTQPIKYQYAPSPQQLNYYRNLENSPVDQNEHYVIQPQQSHRPFHGFENNVNNNNFGASNIGIYNENLETELQSNDEANDSEEVNNSEEGDDNDERVRPKDPVHHDTDSKEHYLYNNGQQYIEQKYQVPNHNEFVQNIKLLKKIPKIEKLRVTNEYTNVNVNQYNKYHPENAQPHFLPTPSPEMHVTSHIKHKGKAKTLVFTPSQHDPIANNLELSTPSYLQEHIPTHNLHSSQVTPSQFSHSLVSSTPSPNYFSQSLQSSPVTPPQFTQTIQSSTLPPQHFSTTSSSISDHPVPLLSPQQFLPSTTPLTPYYTTARPEEQSQFIPPEREQFLQIQTPIPSTYGHLPQQLHSLNQPQPQLSVHEEPRPQFYVNQQYPFELPQENQNFNNAPFNQPILENYSPQPQFVQHQIPRPQQRLPLGFPPNPDLQQFDPHNPQPAPLQIPQHHSHYPPNLEQYQLPDHPPLEEHQFYPFQNINTPGRMVHTIYPYKKSDENHSNEQGDYYKGNDDSSIESEQNSKHKDNMHQYSSNINVKYKGDSLINSKKSGNNEEPAEPTSSQTEFRNSRTNNKLRFDYVDSKTRIQPHGVHIVGGNFKLEEFRNGRKQTQKSNNTDNNNNNDKYNFKDEESLKEPYEQNVQEYVDAFNRQESKQNEQISEPDVVIQKSLGTEYRLYSKEEENVQEENRFVPLNFVTPLPENIYESPLNNNEADFNGFHRQALNFNGPTLQSPQIQHNHFIQHVTSNTDINNLKTENDGNNLELLAHELQDPSKTLNVPNSLSNNNLQYSKNIPLLFYNNLDAGSSSRNPYQFNKAPIDHLNNDPSHYPVKSNFNMPGINKGEPTVNAFPQFGLLNGNNQQSIQNIVNHKPKVIKPQEIPLVLNPALLIKAHAQTHSNQLQNEKVKIIIPTIVEQPLAEQRAPVQKVHYKIPNGEVIINRFHGLGKQITKPSNAASNAHLQHPQPFQNNNVVAQSLPITTNQQISHQQNNFRNTNHDQKQTPGITQSNQPIALNLLNQNIQQFNKGNQNIIQPQSAQDSFNRDIEQLQKNYQNIIKQQTTQDLLNKNIGQYQNSHQQIPQPQTSQDLINENIHQSQNNHQSILTSQPVRNVYNQNIQQFEKSHQNIPGPQKSQNLYNLNIQQLQNSHQNVHQPQHFQKNKHNNIQQQNILQLNTNNAVQQLRQNHQPSQLYQNQQAIKNIPSNHQHYDIFGEYGQKKQYKEPYVFEFPNVHENNQPLLSNANNLNGYQANVGYNPQNMQVFQPIVLDFDNPNSNFYYRNNNKGVHLQHIKPQLSEPAQLPSSLVNGVESEAIVTKKIKHPSFHDLSYEPSEHRSTVINITGTGLVNPHAKNEKNKSSSKKATNDAKLELTPMMNYLTISQNVVEKPSGSSEKNSNHSSKQNNSYEDSKPSFVSDEIMEKTQKPSNNLTTIFHFENNEHNIPILSSGEGKNGSNKDETNKSLDSNVSSKNIGEKYNHNNEHFEDKMQIKIKSTKKPGDSYENINLFNVKEEDTFSNNYDTLDSSTEFEKKASSIETIAQKTIYDKYMDSLNKSYDIIRHSMKKEDEKDKIDISGLYNTYANKSNNKTNDRTSKKLFSRYEDIERIEKSPKKSIKNSRNQYAPQNHQKQNVFGKTIDINYFNRRKNGLFSNENIFDDEDDRKSSKDKSNRNNNSKRILNLLKDNIQETPK